VYFACISQVTAGRALKSCIENRVKLCTMVLTQVLYWILRIQKLVVVTYIRKACW
jgi:hypothetical protein